MSWSPMGLPVALALASFAFQWRGVFAVLCMVPFTSVTQYTSTKKTRTSSTFYGLNTLTRLQTSVSVQDFSDIASPS